ncbi:MAG TPA: HAD-IIB family hydrolase [Thermomicrobiales bacterium]|nr:HAD-IIB family hydrolase [Thermomicrobiales bacterium]
MRYIAIAVDFDGTLAKNGKVLKKTIGAVERARESGRYIVMVTGRRLDDLQKVFPTLDLFDRVVAENGALLYDPATRVETVLGEPPPDELVAALRERKVKRLATGRSIVALREPDDAVALEVINELGLERQIIYNKGAVMLLPSGINKETGLRAALAELGISPHNTLGIGDAENDHAFLSACEWSFATANAIDAIKQRADRVTEGDHGTGVVEAIDPVLEDGVDQAMRKIGRHDLLLGHSGDEPVGLKPSGTSILISGPSGSGKSTAAAAIVERLGESGYQFCIVDPEGDYEELAGAVQVGTAGIEPNLDEVMQLLAQPEQNVVVNLLGIQIASSILDLEFLLPRLVEMRVQLGRPHWIVVDEAHHLFPVAWEPVAETMPRELGELLLITIHPDHVARPVLRAINTVIAVGDDPGGTFASFAKAVRGKAPALKTKLKPGEVALWRRGSRTKPAIVKVKPAEAERRRHRRKYAVGEIPEHEHFYFVGPRGEMALRAQNLMIFLQIADGVDDETWDWHLTRGDYTNWFRHVIKDDELAAAAEKVRDAGLSPTRSRQRIRAEVEERYTLPE